MAGLAGAEWVTACALPDEVLPDEKQARIRELQDTGEYVAMTGEGSRERQSASFYPASPSLLPADPIDIREYRFSLAE